MILEMQRDYTGLVAAWQGHAGGDREAAAFARKAHDFVWCHRDAQHSTIKSLHCDLSPTTAALSFVCATIDSHGCVWVDRDMQVVIEKLQAGARKAQEVAAKIESPPPNADAAEILVSARLL